MKHREDTSNTPAVPEEGRSPDGGAAGPNKPHPLPGQQGGSSEHTPARFTDSADSERRRSRSGESAESDAPSECMEIGTTAGKPTADAVPDIASTAEAAATRIRGLTGRGGDRRRRLAKKAADGNEPKRVFTAEQRLMLLDTWFRSGLPGRDFGSLVGVSQHTLYKWKKRFEDDGPAGLMDRPKGGRRGSRLTEVTKRSILMLKEAHPEYGCQRISDELARGPALGASASAVSRVLHETGYELVEEPTRRHPDKPRRFERARPNELWQTDLFTFILKRQNRRVHLVAFMDDHSRFITGFGLHSTSSAAMVIETFRAAICSYHAPQEVLTDNGSQYITWRGKSAFAKECEKHGIRQIVASPRRPQTLGKIERFWGTLWRGLVETAIFLDLEDARRRIGFYIDHYNFQRPHRGIDGLVPADRFFGSAKDVLATMKSRIAENARHLAVNGIPAKSVYLTGHVDGKPLSLHREGGKVILLEDGRRQDVDLIVESAAPAASAGEASSPASGDTRGSATPAIGRSALDTGLSAVAKDIEAGPSGKEDGNEDD